MKTNDDMTDKSTRLKTQEARKALAPFTSFRAPAVTDDIWDMLHGLLRDVHPILYDVLSSNKDLTKSNRRICVLLALGFRAGEIGRLMSLSPQSLANMKRHINGILFGDRNAASLPYNMMRIDLEISRTAHQTAIIDGLYCSEAKKVDEC